MVEATLFRHFPTKALLFEQAVIAPLEASVTEIAEVRRGFSNDVATESAAFMFYSEILVILQKDSRLLIAALAALTFESETAEFTRLRDAFNGILSYLDEVVERRSAERGFQIEPRLSVRMMLGMILGLTLADPMIFEQGTRPPTEELAAAMAKFTAYGIPGAPTHKV